ncbi:MAG: methionine--tRNA ligase [Flammeovirgaceae bacterium TMED290]|nr:MAG: methionine--tRNA ligase [Flammeovirgaceae bacterium TMED290]
MNLKVSKRKKHLVTSALIYANGPIHIGHLAGCYIPSDIYVRYLRSIGDDVKFISGTDEHGVPITIKARNEKKKPKEIVDFYYKQIKKNFEEFGISFDIFSRTSNNLHHETSSDFFLKLYRNDVFDEIESSQYYDESENQFLSDRYIKGECPCGLYDNAYGDQCEKCGRSLSPSDLKNPVSTLSNNKPVMKKTKNWYLPMDKLQKKVEKYLDDKSNWKSNVIGQCNSWLNEGLKPRAMTRDLDWGVKVPIEDAEGKVLYVWFDAPIGYITATKELVGDNWEGYWKDKETNLVHFIGKDNIVFHCIIFPMMLIEHGGFILPNNVPANEFMNLEGEKISTSRNWAVWLDDYLKDFPNMQDELRYCLIKNLPENKDSDFTWKDFQAKNNNELVSIVGNYVNRVFVLTDKFFNKKVPISSGKNESFIKELDSFKRSIEISVDNFKFREAMSYVIDVARLGNKYLTDNEPWKKYKDDPDFVSEVIYNSIQVVANLAILCEPFLPHTSNKIFELLNIKRLDWKSFSGNVVLSGHEISDSAHIFSRIEDNVIDDQIEKLNKSKQKKDNIMPQKKIIEFDDFSKVDIRIGTVVKAEKVPKSNKLLRLKVNTGVDERVILSGISKFYSPEEIINKKVMVLINLKPRKMMGYESEGMLLLAEDSDGKLSLMQPDSQVGDGSIVA